MIAARRWLRAVVALLLLHAVAVAPFPFQTATFLVALQTPSPDLLLLLVVVVVGGAAGCPRWSAWLGGAVLLVTTLFRLAIAVVPLTLGRPFELVDLVLLPGLHHLLVHDLSNGARLGWTIGACVGLLLVYLLFVWMLATVARAFGSGRSALCLFAIVQAAVIALLFGMLPAWHPSTLARLAELNVRLVLEWIDPETARAPVRDAMAAGALRMAAAPKDLSAANGVDVYVLVVESYGAVAWRRPELEPTVRARWQQADTELTAAGFRGAVGFVHPSIVGGGSWMAHQELLTAVRVPTQRVWDAVLTSSLDTVPKRFKQAGWRTLEVMPAMNRHWPEGEAFYGFSESLTQLELGYQGTSYGWGQMPDQFALHHLLERVVGPAELPLFVFYASVSSHAPWARLPHFVDDWRIGATTFQVPPVAQHELSWLDVPGDPRLVPAYRDSLDYSLRAALGFVARLPRPSVVLLFGDHQPPLAFHDEAFGVRRDVPLHVLTNRPEGLEPWLQNGLVAGFDPLLDPTSAPLAEIGPLLLTAIGGK